jgi:pimeloyl-ACP methyl ester carboxylesterase
MTTVPWHGRDPSRKARWIAWLLLLIPALVIAVYPTAQDYLRAVSLLQRIADPHAPGWIASYDVHPVDVRDTSFTFKGNQIAARLYMPQGVGSAPGILVVHGMHELGIHEPRLVSFARSLAAGGFFVMTPQVPGIADYRVEAESADLIGQAAQNFAQQLEVPKVGVLALSFSGGLALIAAGDPQYSNSIAWVAAVGAYYDLAHVLHFFATGEAPRPDGSFEHLSPHEYGALIVIYDEPQDFFAPQDARAARNAIKLLLAGHGKASEELTRTMTPAGRQIMQDIYQKQRTALAPAILAEIEKRQQQLAAASPAGRLKLLHVPVFLLHGSDDTVIPPTELLWLRRDIPRDDLLGALISPAITHVEVGGRVTLRQRLALVHWVKLMIQTAEATQRSTRAKPLPAGAWLARGLTPGGAALQRCVLRVL